MSAILAILALFSVRAIFAECPNIRDVPVMYDNERFMCAVRWRGEGHQYPVDACNTCNEAEFPEPETGIYIFDGEEGFYDPTAYFYSMGSLIVKPGCTLYLYSASPDDAVKAAEPGLYTDFGGPDPPNGHECATGYFSYKCRCSMEPVACTPEDGYQTIIQCDNSESIETTECNYAKTIGTSFSDSMSASMSVDVTVSASMKASFWGIFEASLGVSATTGYDWTHATDVTMSEQVTVEVKASVRPGFILQIKQAVGECGGSQAKTELFKIVHIDGKTGSIVREEYERTFANGTVVKINH